jgi:hypothetical protein
MNDQRVAGKFPTAWCYVYVFGALSNQPAARSRGPPRSYNEDARRGLRVLGGLNAQSWLIQTTRF